MFDYLRKRFSFFGEGSVKEKEMMNPQEKIQTFLNNPDSSDNQKMFMSAIKFLLQQVNDNLNKRVESEKVKGKEIDIGGNDMYAEAIKQYEKLNLDTSGVELEKALKIIESLADDCMTKTSDPNLSLDEQRFNASIVRMLTPLATFIEDKKKEAIETQTTSKGSQPGV